MRKRAPVVDRRTKKRSRPTPRWLLQQEDLDEIARRRCLLILSVLSGERAVSDAIEEAQISRGTYYKLEERALKAMLASLLPSAEGTEEPTESPAKRIAQLEAKVSGLERERRRSERLLLLTRKIVRKGPVTTGLGRPPKKRPSSTSDGQSASRPSKASTSSPPPSPSTPMPDGEAAP